MQLPVYVVVRLCVHFWTCLHVKQGIALSFIIVITGIMTSVGDKRYSTAWWKPETVTAVFGTGQSRCNYWEEEWATSRSHQYSSQWMYPSIRCLFLHCSVVWQRRQQQHSLNRNNFACLFAELVIYSQALNTCMYYNVQKEPLILLHCSFVNEYTILNNVLYLNPDLLQP